MGCILIGYLKLLPLWIFVFPGMASRVLFPDEVTCADPDLCEEICQSPLVWGSDMTGNRNLILCFIYFRYGCTNLAYIKLVTNLLPVRDAFLYHPPVDGTFFPLENQVGFRGLLVSVMLAALMTSLTSVFNSSAAIFTVDIYKRIRCGRQFLWLWTGDRKWWLDVRICQGN